MGPGVLLVGLTKNVLFGGLIGPERGWIGFGTFMAKGDKGLLVPISPYEAIVKSP
jgi:hypothetical protein